MRLHTVSSVPRITKFSASEPKLCLLSEYVAGGSRIASVSALKGPILTGGSGEPGTAAPLESSTWRRPVALAIPAPLAQPAPRHEMRTRTTVVRSPTVGSSSVPSSGRSGTAWTSSRGAT